MFHFVIISNTIKSKYLFVLNEHDVIQYDCWSHCIDYHNTQSFIYTFHFVFISNTIKVSTCLFQMNVMLFNMIVATHYIDYHNTHLFHLHIPFCLHIKHK